VIYRLTEDGTVLFLLLQPAPGKPWGFPKGKLDRGETDEQAARREVREETGLCDLTFDPAFRHAIHYHFRRGHGVVRKEVSYYLARADADTVRISSEHVAYRWATYRDARELVVFDNARDTLHDAYAAIRARHGMTVEE
jgi:8-oxo-dGTP pyrophosphatase MutT (NUDIX family)